ncbi:hypothetical protein HK101_010307 [Irineochytrium annulatum]|nr:hypothetical protein HK101_010307 [Irineochytrium annulatum]
MLEDAMCTGYQDPHLERIPIKIAIPPKPKSPEELSNFLIALQEGAYKANASAQNELAYFYEKGEGVLADPRMAYKLYKWSSKQSNRRAINNLAFCIKKGVGCQPDQRRAVELYIQAAELGDVSAQFNVGNSLSHGIGVERDPVKAAHYYRLAANQGHAKAQCALADCYRIGDGVPRDVDSALKLYQLSADQGNGSALNNMGNFRFSGATRLAKDARLAAHLYRKAANLGNAAAQNNLAHCLENGVGVKPDAKAAFRWYARSCLQGNTEACMNLARCYEQGLGVDRDPLKALDLYTRCVATNPKALNNLGRLHRTLNDPVASFDAYSRSAAAGDASGLNNLASCHFHGVGAAVDLKKALELYERAASMGHDGARVNAERVRKRLAARNAYHMDPMRRGKGKAAGAQQKGSGGVKKLEAMKTEAVSGGEGKDGGSGEMELPELPKKPVLSKIPTSVRFEDVITANANNPVTADRSLKTRDGPVEAEEAIAAPFNEQEPFQHFEGAIDGSEKKVAPEVQAKHAAESIAGPDKVLAHAEPHMPDEGAHRPLSNEPYLTGNEDIVLIDPDSRQSRSSNDPSSAHGSLVSLNSVPETMDLDERLDEEDEDADNNEEDGTEAGSIPSLIHTSADKLELDPAALADPPFLPDGAIEDPAVELDDSEDSGGENDAEIGTEAEAEAATEADVPKVSVERRLTDRMLFRRVFADWLQSKEIVFGEVEGDGWEALRVYLWQAGRTVMFSGEQLIAMWFSLSREALSKSGQEYQSTKKFVPILAFLSNLQILNLGMNRLSGGIPMELGLLKNLKELSLMYNRLRGLIPKELACLTNLKHLWLNNNRLIGPIPNLSPLRKLEKLYLESNQLTGKIPRWIGDLRDLQHLRLSHNLLRGPVNPEVCRLARLHTLCLHANHLSGPLPSLDGLVNAREIRLGRNRIEGPLPDVRLPSIERLHLESNEIGGTLPSGWGALTTLVELRLDGNKIEGRVPAEWGAMRRLDALDLSGNDIAPELPGGLEYLRQDEVGRMRYHRPLKLSP